MRELRSLRGWTQQELAEAAGLHPVHISRIELGIANAALPTLVAIALALNVQVHALFGLRRGAEDEQPFRSSTAPDAIPLYDLRVAAGSFGAGQSVEAIDEVVPRSGIATRPGMFIAKVSGESMEPLIPDGAYCLFAPVKGRPPAGRIVLAQLRGVEDPDTGGAYSVKRLKMASRRPPRLVPENPAFEEIVVRRSDDLRVIAEVVAVLGVRRVRR